MIYNYPFFSFPRFKRYSVSTINPTPASHVTYEPHSSYRNISTNSRPFVFTSSPYAHYIPVSSTVVKQRKEKKCNRENFACKADKNQENSFFEIFGIKLYYDDILLICLIFFLYQEEVDDPYLFIALILLLLS